MDLPTGTVTLLFTDIEGSTALAERLGDGWPALLADHHRLLREAFTGNGGHEFGTEGDAFFVVFREARDAVAAAAAAQRSLAAHRWPEGAPVRVRIGVHSGEPTATADGYVGIDLHRAARVAGAAHGGQVLVSETTRKLVPEAADGLTFRDLGEHRLKDLSRPQRLHQLCVPGLPSEFPRLRTLEGRRTNLPAQPTPLVGRDEELEAVRRLARDEDVRLVTLTGPGGSGKTRLALQVAADLVDEFDDGTFAVELAMVTDAAVVLPEIARTVEVEEAPPAPLAETLKTELHPRKTLLLLDNFEQVSAASGSILELVTACPRLTLLVTSREPLHLTGERQYPVPPLRLPDVDGATPETLLESDAAKLFVERARAVRPDFEVMNATAAAIAEICMRLDGLPLAIELAAAWSKVLPPPALLERLKRGLDLAARPGAALPERQSTLRNTIAWSYELLSEGERRLHARLAVFAGGCTLDAAERVCTPAADLELDALEGLASLVDRSLLQEMDDAHGEPRFTMLVTIRDYAREQLAESGEENELLRRHALEFARFAEEADEALRGSDQLLWLERLEREHDNLRAALDASLETGDVETALRLGGALGWFWYAHGHALEGCRRLNELLDATKHAPEHLRAPSMYSLGVLLDVRGESEAAADLVERSLAVFRERGDAASIARALNSLGVIEWRRGNLVRARSLLEESIAVRRGLGEEARIASALSNLGLIAFEQGDLATAELHFDESLALDRAQGNDWGIAADLENLATVALEQGEHERARALIRETIQAVRQVGDKELIALALEIAAALAAADGNADGAGRLEGAADALRERIGAPRQAFEAGWLERHLATVAGPLLDPGRSAGRLLDEERALEEAADVVERRGHERASSPNR